MKLAQALLRFPLLASTPLLLAVAAVPATAAAPAARPNVLWLTSEDNGPFLGCYGDPHAQTPHLDRLAAEGVRYLVHEGQEVWTKLDERVLRDASIAGEGAYIPAGTDRVEMARAYEQTVGALERQEYEGTTVTRRTPRFQWFAGASFALLLAAAALPDRRAAKGGSR